MKRKNIAVLGSTGSVGRQALDVARQEKHGVLVLSAKQDYVTLEEQAREFKPFFCIIDDKFAYDQLKIALADTDTKVIRGGYEEALQSSKPDVVVNAVSGAAGLMPTLAAIDAGGVLALANKESLVMAGDIVMKKAKEKGCRIIPVDSEHSAVFQCLRGNKRNRIKSLVITASGGPFFGMSEEETEHISAETALKHPTWKMGKKISIDSATLMNKGFEVIEASTLFSVPSDKIHVLIHRESIVHSMAEFEDNCLLAQLSVPDMRLCVQYAVNFPCRRKAVIGRLSLAEVGALTFEEPGRGRYPLLDLAYRCLDEGGTKPAILNAVNEVAVDRFLNGKIGFNDISRQVVRLVSEIRGSPADSIDEVLEADAVARKYAAERIGRQSGS